MGAAGNPAPSPRLHNNDLTLPRGQNILLPSETKQKYVASTASLTKTNTDQLY